MSYIYKQISNLLLAAALVVGFVAYVRMIWPKYPLLVVAIGLAVASFGVLVFGGEP